ncbi:MAG: hypothetical protein AAFZ17_22110 [Cyanobacteria bacterium J06650_10]
MKQISRFNGPDFIARSGNLTGSRSVRALLELGGWAGDQESAEELSCIPPLGELSQIQIEAFL